MLLLIVASLESVGAVWVEDVELVGAVVCVVPSIFGCVKLVVGGWKLECWT